MSDLLSPRELRAVRGLRLAPRGLVLGRQRGERITRRKGISIDFADHRDYTEGDDLRHLDWNVLARLGTPVVKTYMDEEDLAVHLLVDTSASMDFGEPTKHQTARQLAAGLALVALQSGDAVRPWALGDAPKAVRTYRGSSNVAAISRWLQAQPRQRRSSLAHGLQTFVASDQPNGVALIVTDGLDPELPAVLHQIGARGHEPWLLCVLSQLDLDPDLDGDLRVVDSENDGAVDITANTATLLGYKQALSAHLDRLRSSALRAGGRFAQITSDQTFEDAMHRVLRREAWFQ